LPVIGLPGMSTLEVAAGTPIGFDPTRERPLVSAEPMAALEEAVTRAVRRTPCLVSFSGGRDSSLVLAACVRAARAQGAPPPVAAILRYPELPETDEGKWQELVLEHLGLGNRLVVEITHELDFVGTNATAQLRRHGVLFPANGHSLVPLLPHAAGGSVLLGLGGDELFNNHRWTNLNEALSRRRRPEPRDLARLAAASLPGRLRGTLLARKRRRERRWLRPPAARLVRVLERRAADEPLRFDRAVEKSARSRVLAVALESLGRLGRSGGVEVEAPLLDPRFVAALARAGGARGWGDRSATMRAVAGGLLPDELLDRRDKALFNATFFGEATRRFAEEWSGQGVDTSLVDPDALRQTWLEPDPDFRSALLLQLAWLRDHGR
jgi:asparagine synthetase B (glutamine-hydrolysing)